MPSDRKKYPEYGSKRYQNARARLLAGGPPCFWGCGRPATTADHDPPLAETGTWHWRLVPACGPCNFSRRGKTPELPTLLPSRDW